VIRSREQFATTRAVALLGQAVVKGFKEPEQLKDIDLDPLRLREDFQKLLRELVR
jgi:hypothetical protein